MELAGTRDWRDGTVVSREGPCEQDSAFTAFVERNLRFAFRVAYALVHNRADADDVAQECFLRLHRKRAWMSIANERAYIARVVWRLARDRQRHPPREEGGMEMDAVTATDDSPEAAAVANHSIAHIHRMINALPEELRQPLVRPTIIFTSDNVSDTGKTELELTATEIK